MLNVILNSIIKKGARRLTSDKYPGILNNYYFKPSYKTPYYYIYNDDSGQVKTGTPVIIKLFYGEDKNINISDISIDYIKYPNEGAVCYPIGSLSYSSYNLSSYMLRLYHHLIFK